MARYYFNVRDGDKIISDEEGMELPTADGVWTEAVHSLAELARDTIPRHRDAGHRMSIEVRDADGPVVLAQVTFSFARHRQ